MWPWVKTYDAIGGWLFTSINPIYFDVHYTMYHGFDPLPFDLRKMLIASIYSRDWTPFGAVVIQRPHYEVTRITFR